MMDIDLEFEEDTSPKELDRVFNKVSDLFERVINQGWDHRSLGRVCVGTPDDEI